MKNWIKILIVICLIGFTGIVSAGISIYVTLPKGNVQMLENEFLGNKDVNILKVVDGVNTCYVTYVKSNTGQTVSSDISCLK